MSGQYKRWKVLLIVTLGLLALIAPAQASIDAPSYRTRLVTVTAYNSVESQCDADPDIAAWGDRLKPGMRVIAVSRDLLRTGLRRNARVRIAGMRGEFLVLDKMHPRWRNRIDVYMGEDVQAALRFGKRDLEISWAGGL